MWVLLHWRGDDGVVGVCALCVCNLSFTFFTSGCRSSAADFKINRVTSFALMCSFNFAQNHGQLRFDSSSHFFILAVWFVHAWMLYRFLWILLLGGDTFCVALVTRVNFFTAWNWSMTLTKLVRVDKWGFLSLAFAHFSEGINSFVNLHVFF